MLPWEHAKINSSESPSTPLSPHELYFFPAATHLPTKANRCFLRFAAKSVSSKVNWWQDTAEYVLRDWACSEAMVCFPQSSHTSVLIHACTHSWKSTCYRENHFRKLVHPVCFPQSTASASLLPWGASSFRVDQKMLLIWTYPRTELHHKSTSAQSVKWGGFGALLSPLTLYRAVHCMWKNTTSCYTSPGALISLVLLHGHISGINQGL